MEQYPFFIQGQYTLAIGNHGPVFPECTFTGPFNFPILQVHADKAFLSQMMIGVVSDQDRTGHVPLLSIVP